MRKMIYSESRNRLSDALTPAEVNAARTFAVSISASAPATCRTATVASRWVALAWSSII